MSTGGLELPDVSPCIYLIRLYIFHARFDKTSIKEATGFLEGVERKRQARKTLTRVVFSAFDLLYNKHKWRKTIKRLLHQPQEKTSPEPFKRRVFSENVNRMKKIFGVLSRLNTYLQSCFSWEKPRRSLRAFLVFQFVVFFFEPFMAPLFAMAVFFAYPVLTNSLDEDDAFTDPFVEDQGSLFATFFTKVFLITCIDVKCQIRSWC